MSRTFKLLAVALFATVIVGCGDKEGDDGSNNSEGVSPDTGSSDLDNSSDSGNSDLDTSSDTSDLDNEGSDLDNEGSDLDNVGSDLDNVGSDLDNVGSDLDNVGSDLDNVGSDLDNEGSDLDNEGSDLDNEGSDLDNEGSDLDNEGSDLDNEGSDLDNEGSDLDNEGSDLDNEGSDLDNVGSDLDNEGSDLDNEGSDLDNEGNSSEGSGSVQRKPKTYSDNARDAFEQGHDDLALKYTYAAILTDANAAKNQKLHYWAGPRKPTMAIRWGVGISYIAPKNLTSRPPMIGDKPNLPERREDGDTRNNTGNSRVFGRKNRDEVDSGDTGYSDGGDGTGAGDGSGGGKFRLPSDSWGQLLYLTGNVGERFIERLDMRRVRGYYGDVLKVAPPVQRKHTGGDDGGTADYTDDLGTEDYGDARQSSGQSGPQLIPGVTMLGLGSSKELLSRAEQQGLDVVLVFEVAYTKTLRTSIERNDTVMRLYLVTDGKELRKATPLNNLAVWNERENLKGDKDDPVDLAIDSILSSFADEHVRAGDLPNLNAEMAKIRVTSLTENKVADPLPVLAEIKYYHTQHWLTDSELADAFKQVMGDVGLQLATGSLEDQKKALATYLGTDVESSITPSGTNTGGFR